MQDLLSKRITADEVFVNFTDIFLYYWKRREFGNDQELNFDRNGFNPEQPLFYIWRLDESASEPLNYKRMNSMCLKKETWTQYSYKLFIIANIPVA